MRNVLRLEKSIWQKTTPVVWKPFFLPIALILTLILAMYWFNIRHVEKSKHIWEAHYEDRVKLMGHVFNVRYRFIENQMNADRSAYAKQNIHINKLLNDLKTMNLSFEEFQYLGHVVKNHKEWADLNLYHADNRSFSVENLQKANILKEIILSDLDTFEKLISSNLTTVTLSQTKLIETDKVLLHTEIIFLIVFALIIQMSLFYPLWKKRNGINQ